VTGVILGNQGGSPDQFSFQRRLNSEPRYTPSWRVGHSGCNGV